MPNVVEPTLSRRFELEIFLISFAALLLEISYTRLISFKLWYYYTYLVIGFALLGIGSGGVLVSVFPRLARVPLDRLVATGSLAASITSGSATCSWPCCLPTPAPLGSARAGGREAAADVPGPVRELPPGRVHDLRAARSEPDADRPALLRGSARSGRGVRLGDPAAPASHAARLHPARRPAPGRARGAIGVAVVATAPRREPRRERDLSQRRSRSPKRFPSRSPDASKSIQPDTRRLFSAWNPVFRVDVTEGSDSLRMVHHDGLPGSGLHRFDGDLGSLTRFDARPALLRLPGHRAARRQRLDRRSRGRPRDPDFALLRR